MLSIFSPHCCFSAEHCLVEGRNGGFVAHALVQLDSSPLQTAIHSHVRVEGESGIMEASHNNYMTRPRDEPA